MKTTGMILSAFLLLSGNALAQDNIALNKPTVAYEPAGAKSGAAIVDGNPSTSVNTWTNERMPISAEIDLQGPHTINKIVVKSGEGGVNGPFQVHVRYHDGFCWVTPPGGDSTQFWNVKSQNTVIFNLPIPVLGSRVQVIVRAQSNMPMINEVEVYGSPSNEILVNRGGHCQTGPQMEIQRNPWYNSAVHYPPRYNEDPNKRYPLIIYMTGIGGGTLENFDNGAIQSYAEGLANVFINPATRDQMANYEAIVVNMDCRRLIGHPYGCWFDHNMVLRVIEYFERSHLVDKDGIWLTGLSGGGILSFRGAAYYGNKLAGVVAVATQNEQFSCIHDKLHIWHINGTFDGLFPPERAYNNKAQVDGCAPTTAPSNYRVSILPGGHNAATWDVAYSDPEVQNFMIVNKRLPENGGGLPDPTPVNKRPEVSAGADRSLTLPTNSVSLTASAKDPEGDAMVFLWTQTFGPAAAVQGGTNALTLNVGNLVQGTYVFRFSATDSKGAMAADDVQVVVNPAPPENRAPVVSAGKDQAITLPTNSATLTATATDPDSDPMTYAWKKVSGPYGTMGATNALTLTLSDLAVGEHTLHFAATDSKGAASGALVKVIVNPAPNRAPTVNAGADLTKTLPENTARITAGAGDLDGDPLTFIWSQISGPAITAATGMNSASLNLSSLSEGVYVLRITVKDPAGAQASDDMQLTVKPAPLPSPSPSPVPPPSGNVALNKPVTASSHFIKHSAGVYIPERIVDGIVSMDDTGRWASNDPTPQWIEVDLQKVEVLTKIILHMGKYGSDYLTEYDIVGKKSASDPYLPLVSVRGNSQMTLTHAIDNQEARFVRVNCLKSMNPDGLCRIKELEVYGGGVINQPPTVDAGTDLVKTLPDNSATLVASARDPENAALSYSWSKISGPALSLNGASTASLSLSGLLEGTYVFRVVVKDPKGASASDDVQVTVKPAPALPPTNVALRKSVTASSTFAKHSIGYYVPEKIVDGLVTNTDEGRWCSNDPNPQWVEIDLAQKYNLSKLVFAMGKYGAEHVVDYDILVRDSSTEAWRTAVSIRGNTEMTRTHAIAVSGRHVKVDCIKSSSADGLCRIKELEVWGN